MRRWETLLSLLAVILASVAAVPIEPRLYFAMAAIALLAIVGAARIRSAVLGRTPRPEIADAASRARQIRLQRGRRR
ncbi:MAG: hypothetical protein M3R51_08660 [Candidatus Eremiobacteraeota bacterium]|nr:hypothetical protein [Candidatus Eremiobacteraeota bacterium]